MSKAYLFGRASRLVHFCSKPEAKAGLILEAGDVFGEKLNELPPVVG